MFPTVQGFCNEDLRDKVQNRDNLDSLESSGENLSLLNDINQEDYGLQSAEYTPVAYHQVQIKFYCLIQG